MKYTTLATLFTLLAVSAHPGADHHHEAQERAEALSLMGKRSLSHCAEKLAARGIHAKNQLRRRAFLDSVQAMRNRDITQVLATDHKSNLTGITNATSPDSLFTGKNQCLLAPEVTQGPYCECRLLVPLPDMPQTSPASTCARTSPRARPACRCTSTSR